MVPDDARIGEALLALAAPDGVADAATAVAPLDGDGDADRFLNLVSTHGLTGPLVDVLGALGRPVDDRLRRLVDGDQLIRLRAAGVLRTLQESLDRAALPWAVFKGPMVARVMARPELRTYNDLDILVAPDRFGEALDLLAASTAVELNENWDPYVRHRVGEVPLTMGGVAVDLHWHLIGLRRLRRTLTLETDEILARRRDVAWGDLVVPTFDPADQLLHLAVHSALSGARRLDQLRDLSVVLRADAPDMDVFERRARAAGVARLVAHPLDRARRLLDAPLEEAVVERLGGRSVRWRRRGETGLPQSLRGASVTAWRDSLPATARAAAIRTWDQLAGVTGRAQGWDFADPDSRLFHGRPTGGARRRAEFLAAVPQWAVGD